MRWWRREERGGGRDGVRMEVREEDGAEETRERLVGVGMKVEGIVVGEGIAVGVVVGLVEVEVVIVVGAVVVVVAEEEGKLQ